ncbi:MAG TPA: hypothetical protein PLH15_05740 [Spirochaetota bacterium]|nr:hypothetical protein [Spirochaetota bacterium]HQQ23323.1 hypothetical protein [Spirochaetota bacterium]
MLTDMMLTLISYTIIIVILIVIDGFITGFAVKEIKKYLVFILLLGYVAIVIYHLGGFKKEKKIKLYYGNQNIERNQ